MVLTVFAKEGCVFPMSFALNSTWPSIEPTTIVKTQGGTRPTLSCEENLSWTMPFDQPLVMRISSSSFGISFVKTSPWPTLKKYKFTHPNFFKLLHMKINLIVWSSTNDTATYLSAENSWSLVPSKLLRVRNILDYVEVDRPIKALILTLFDLST